VVLDWQPFELRPGAPEAGWALPERVRAMKNSPHNPLKQRARDLGIELAERDWIPSSRRAHECTEFARDHGALEPFHAAVLRMYWTDGRDIHDWDVLASAAVDAGLDAAAMRAAVSAGTLAPVVDERVAAAHAVGVHAVPTFLIDDRFLIEGAQPLDVFERVMARLGG
jgi:predicted DsbA family dithiol-disulfide isomerase